jgi:hypothetical protein
MRKFAQDLQCQRLATPVVWKQTYLRVVVYESLFDSVSVYVSSTSAGIS